MTITEDKNKKQITHTYHVNDKILLRRDDLAKYSQEPYEGPYNITEVNDNGTVCMRKGAVMETVNI